MNQIGFFSGNLTLSGRSRLFLVPDVPEYLLQGGGGQGWYKNNSFYSQNPF